MQCRVNKLILLRVLTDMVPSGPSSSRCAAMKRMTSACVSMRTRRPDSGSTMGTACVRRSASDCAANSSGAPDGSGLKAVDVIWSRMASTSDTCAVAKRR